MTAVTAFIAYLWANKLAAAGLAVGVVGGASVFVAAVEKCLAFLLVVFPSLQGPDDELKHVAAWLDALANASWLNTLALNRTAKALLVPLLALALFTAAPARASGFDYSIGPTIPLVEIPLSTKVPVQLAPGAGLQLSVTLDALKIALAGKSWDMVDATAMAFGSAVNGANGAQFGALSVAGGLGFMSSLVFVGVGTHVLSTNEALATGQPFLLFALNFNLSFAPQAPPVGTEKGAPGLVRGNVLYLGGL